MVNCGDDTFMGLTGRRGMQLSEAGNGDEPKQLATPPAEHFEECYCIISGRMINVCLIHRNFANDITSSRKEGSKNSRRVKDAQEIISTFNSPFNKWK